MLGSKSTHAQIHRQIYQDMVLPSTIGDDSSVGRTWSRLVLKYWFLDEAATGAEASNGRLPEEHLPALSLASSKSLKNQPPSDIRVDGHVDDESAGNFSVDSISSAGYYSYS